VSGWSRPKGTKWLFPRWTELRPLAVSAIRPSTISRMMLERGWAAKEEAKGGQVQDGRAARERTEGDGGG
jgi:hypothetical protein